MRWSISTTPWRWPGPGPAGGLSRSVRWSITAEVSTATALAEVFRQESGRLTAALIRRFGDFDLAEESVQDAIVAALTTWPRDGVPARPGAWLTTSASRFALNRLDRERRGREKLERLAVEPATSGGDDRLRLILTCCHPALPREAQVGLTLRAVAGFTTAEIARAFVASEAAVAQRLVRAKRRIAATGIPFRIPSEAELAGRLDEVLAVLYLIFNEAHLSTAGGVATQRDLAEDAAWLCGLVCKLLPEEPEPAGLLALMQLHLARGDARFSETGELVLLAEQDRSLWDAGLVATATATLTRAAARHRPGPYQLEAAIAACHAEARSFEATDWRQIVVLYDMLLVLTPTPVIRLNRAIAAWKLEGAGAALAEVEPLAASLDAYHLYHAARAALLDDLGRHREANAARLRALDLTRNPAEVALLRRRLFAFP